MKVYRSQIDIEYEPPIVLGIFSSFEKAKEIFKKSGYHDDHNDHNVYEHTIDDMNYDEDSPNHIWTVNEHKRNNPNPIGYSKFDTAGGKKDYNYTADSYQTFDSLCEWLK